MQCIPPPKTPSNPAWRRTNDEVESVVKERMNERHDQGWFEAKQSRTTTGYGRIIRERHVDGYSRGIKVK